VAINIEYSVSSNPSFLSFYAAICEYFMWRVILHRDRTAAQSGL